MNINIAEKLIKIDCVQLPGKGVRMSKGKTPHTTWKRTAKAVIKNQPAVREHVRGGHQHHPKAASLLRSPAQGNGPNKIQRLPNVPYSGEQTLSTNVLRALIQRRWPTQTPDPSHHLKRRPPGNKGHTQG